MIKSYDYILGNGKFINLFDIITGVIICSAISFCLTETLFSFNFKLSFQKVLIFTILFLLLLLLFYYFIKQRRYKLLDDKIEQSSLQINNLKDYKKGLLQKMFI